MQDEASHVLPPAYNGTEPYIFVSYAHRNDTDVIPIVAVLIKNGYRVWYDDGIDPGTEWDQNIADHIEKCSYFIAFISNEYLESSNCRDEINYARDLNKRRLLIYLADVRLPSGMSMRLNRLQAIHKYTYKNENVFYEKLFAADGINSCRRTDAADAPLPPDAGIQPEAMPRQETYIPPAKSPLPNKKIIISAAAVCAAVLLIILTAAAAGKPKDSAAPAGASVSSSEKENSAPEETSSVKTQMFSPNKIDCSVLDIEWGMNAEEVKERNGKPDLDYPVDEDIQTIGYNKPTDILGCPAVTVSVSVSGKTGLYSLSYFIIGDYSASLRDKLTEAYGDPLQEQTFSPSYSAASWLTKDKKYLFQVTLAGTEGNYSTSYDITFYEYMPFGNEDPVEMDVSKGMLLDDVMKAYPDYTDIVQLENTGYSCLRYEGNIIVDGRTLYALALTFDPEGRLIERDCYIDGDVFSEMYDEIYRKYSTPKLKTGNNARWVVTDGLTISLSLIEPAGGSGKYTRYITGWYSLDELEAVQEAEKPRDDIPEREPLTEEDIRGLLHMDYDSVIGILGKPSAEPSILNELKYIIYNNSTLAENSFALEIGFDTDDKCVYAGIYYDNSYKQDIINRYTEQYGTPTEIVNGVLWATHDTLIYAVASPQQIVNAVWDDPIILAFFPIEMMKDIFENNT